MEMKITLNGVEQTITNQQLYDLAAKGMIGPETPVYVDGKPVPAGRAKGIVFGQPQNTDNQVSPAAEPLKRDGFALPSRQDIQQQQLLQQQQEIQALRQTTQQQQYVIQQQGQTVQQQQQVIQQGENAGNVNNPRKFDYRIIALRQRWFLTSLGLAILLPIVASVILAFSGSSSGPGGLRFVLAGTSLIALLVAFVSWGVSCFSFIFLISSLQKGPVQSILYTLGLFIPLVNLITVIAVSMESSAILTIAGYRVGLFGANMRQFGPDNAMIKSGRPKENFPLILCLCLLIGLPFIVVIFGIGASFALSGVQVARESARRTQCYNHEKEIVLAFHSFHDTNKAFPPLYTVDKDGKPLHSWRVLILPFIGQEKLYKEIRLEEPWDSEHNKQFHRQIIDVYRCQSNHKVKDVNNCCYSVIAGEVFLPAKDTGEKKGLDLMSITDGTSNTLALVEVKEPFCWMDPTADVRLGDLKMGINAKTGRVGGFHPGGIVATLFDGSIRFLSDKTSPKILEALGTRSGGESSTDLEESNADNTSSSAETKIEKLRKAAESGDAKSQQEYGDFFFTNKNYSEAIKWFQKAADQGNADGQFGFGICHLQGFGTKQNSVEAVKWLRKAADQGLAIAQFLLGTCYAKGNGIEENMVEAAQWYQKAANQGESNAQNCLGLCFYQGKGVKLDAMEAAKWFKKSAKQGNSEGQVLLAVCCYKGEGVTQDEEEAKRLLEGSAENGNQDAIALLKKWFGDDK